MSKEKNKKVSLRSSTAEYLTYIASSGGDSENLEILYQDENIWLHFLFLIGGNGMILTQYLKYEKFQTVSGKEYFSLYLLCKYGGILSCRTTPNY